MDRAPAERGEQQQEQHALARRGVREQPGEPVRSRSRPPPLRRSPPATSVPSPGPHVEARDAQVGGAVEQRGG